MLILKKTKRSGDFGSIWRRNRRDLSFIFLFFLFHSFSFVFFVVLCFFLKLTSMMLFVCSYLYPFSQIQSIFGYFFLITKPETWDVDSKSVHV